MAAQIASTVRAAALRKRCLSLAKTCSMGFRSGEYLGKKISLAPAARIVHDDDVAGAQRGSEDLLDIGLKALAVDRAFKKPRGVDPVVAQRSQERRRLPVAVRDLGRKPHAERRPSPQRRHVGLGPVLVDEDQTLRLDLVLIFGPLRPPPSDVGTVAFASHHGFF